MSDPKMKYRVLKKGHWYLVQESYVGEERWRTLNACYTQWGAEKEMNYWADKGTVVASR